MTECDLSKEHKAGLPFLIQSMEFISLKIENWQENESL